MVSRTYLILSVMWLFIVSACSNEKADHLNKHDDPLNTKRAIDSIMTAQEIAWNNGDLDSFMHGYWENDSLLFIGKSGVNQGYETTLENYKKSYPDRRTMGVLKFNNLRYQPLGSSHYLVVGKWSLERDSLKNLSGHYSLIWKNIKGKWHIIADHSS